MTQPAEPARRTNHAPIWMLIIGIPLAIIGAITWKVAWDKADVKVFAAELYGMDATHWTGAVIAGIVMLAIGAVLAIAGVMGIAVRR